MLSVCDPLVRGVDFDRDRPLDDDDGVRGVDTELHDHDPLGVVGVRVVDESFRPGECRPLRSLDRALLRFGRPAAMPLALPLLRAERPDVEDAADDSDGDRGTNGARGSAAWAIRLDSPPIADRCCV